MRARHDVVIVGYGPVGQTLAILLAQRGWTVGVFEKQPAAYPLPRAVHFDHEVARILQAVGALDDLLPTVEPADAYEWRNATGDTLLRFESRAAGASGWPEANMFAQPDLERVLDRRARALPAVEVHRGCDVVELAATDADVAVTVAIPDGRRHTVDARYVVGCDGANSFVRSRLGASVTDLGFFFDWLIVDIVPHAPSVWRPLNIQICDPARPTTLVSGGRGRRRWEFMRLPEETLDALNHEETAWRLLAPWGVTSDNATLERHTVYRFQARWVDTWRRGRVLLAGDAAHQMPPFAGQGMCAGLRDAANLAWKLDLVLAGTASDALLDTYPSERIPHVRAMIDFSMALGRVICVADPAEAAARDAHMVAAARAGNGTAALPPLAIGPGLVHAGDAHAGRPFVQGRVRRNGVTGLFDDVVGRGWTLLSPTADPGTRLAPEAAAFFASLGGVTAHVGSQAPVEGVTTHVGSRPPVEGVTAHVGSRPPVEDVDGTYGRWFAAAAVEIVLQRPDFHVFGTAAHVDDAGALVAQLAQALASETRRTRHE